MSAITEIITSGLKVVQHTAEGTKVLPSMWKYLDELKKFAGLADHNAIVQLVNKGDSFIKFTGEAAEQAKSLKNTGMLERWWMAFKYGVRNLFGWSGQAEKAAEAVAKTADSIKETAFKSGEYISKNHLLNDSTKGVFKLEEETAQLAQKLQDSGASFKLSHGPASSGIKGKTETFIHLVDDPTSVHKYTVSEMKTLMDKGVPFNKLSESTAKLDVKTLESLLAQGYTGEEVSVLHQLGLAVDSQAALLKSAKDAGVSPETIAQVLAKPSNESLQNIATAILEGKTSKLTGYQKAVYDRLKTTANNSAIYSAEGRLPSMGGNVAALSSDDIKRKISSIYNSVFSHKTPNVTQIIENATKGLAIQDANFIRQTVGHPDKLTHQAVLEKLSGLSQGSTSELNAFIKDTVKQAKSAT